MTTYKRFLKGAVLYSQRQLTEIYQRQEAARFSAASRDFEPIEDTLETSDVESQCPPGMRSEGEVCGKLQTEIIYAGPNLVSLFHWL